MSPESCRGKPFLPGNDVWSVGRQIKRWADEENEGEGALQPRAAQAFNYSPENEGVIVDVMAEHHRVKELTDGNAVPPQYCSNRCDGVLTYSVIYDYVVPYLRKNGCWSADRCVISGGVEVSGAEASFSTCFSLFNDTASVSCALQHCNIMLIGNYRKMKRDLSQSPWFTNGQRVGSFSLQEVIINPILSFFFPEGVTPILGKREANEFGGQCEKRSRLEKTHSQRQFVNESNDNPHRMASQHVFGYGRYKFHSAGREDVDVRMLGSGRPFVLEIISPSRQRVTPEDLAAFEETVNKSEGGDVEISQLRLTDLDITVRLARHSQNKVKMYRCVVWCSRAITDPGQDDCFKATNSVRDLVIEQRTPVRVLHRRSLQVRPRTIHSIRLTPLNAHWFVMDVETQAGTYVKEFVHGDMGRTTPHLGMLMNGRTDIIQLDVLDMAMEDL
ncbi:tRNA pseudouridine synthase 10 [Trypanosoma grayi]|uniref:tRNA pseudouridine synthase 10 n=1 Tax=Trypanosoma grayi TaxID=71804 RepID=UPI0004F464EA|nr:tRNA pseudouridine synthase 10 [Trypanosoma grayi]KEG11206.1 tRNA pseudouridine synthase 10 [Trypanosoma grayi]